MSYKKGAVITREVLEDVVANIEYHLFAGTTTMACAVTLGNKFTAVGLSSSLPTTEFSPQLGMKYAHDDAMRKVAEHLAMLVYEELAPRKLMSCIQSNLDVLKENDNANTK